MAEIVHHLVDLSAGQVHIERTPVPDRAQGQLPTLILLPQWPFGAWHYRRALPLLRGSVDAIAVDLPGFGASPPPTVTLDVMAHAELLQDLIIRMGLERVVVLARAASTAPAVRLALRAELLGLILHGPFAHTAAERDARRARAWEPLPPRPDGLHLMDAWDRVTGRYPDLPPDLATACALAHLSAGPGQRAAYRAVWDHDTLAALAELTTPSVAFVGSEEVLAGPFQNLPQNVLRIPTDEVPSSTDHLPWTDPASFAAIVRRSMNLLRIA